MPPEYFMPDANVSMHGLKLPHWQQGNVYQFVTWRLADAIPQSRLRPLAEHRKAWLEVHPQPWDERVEREYHDRFSDAVDAWLDAGAGACVLRNHDINNMVAGALHHFDNQRYVLDSYVVMPNHVHIIFQPLNGHEVAGIVKTWKGFTSRQINQQLGRQGTLWQERYWDRPCATPSII